MLSIEQTIYNCLIEYIDVLTFQPPKFPPCLNYILPGEDEISGKIATIYRMNYM